MPPVSYGCAEMLYAYLPRAYYAAIVLIWYLERMVRNLRTPSQPTEEHSNESGQ
jgi:hypothetical protein